MSQNETNGFSASNTRVHSTVEPNSDIVEVTAVPRDQGKSNSFQKFPSHEEDYRTTAFTSANLIDEKKATVTTKLVDRSRKIAIIPKTIEINSNEKGTTNQVESDEDPGTRPASGFRQDDEGSMDKCLYTLDCFFAAIIVGPMVVAHWRGIWVLMDFHESIFSGWVCFGAGMGGHLVFALLRQPLHESFAAGLESRARCARLGCRLVRSLYTYAFSLACNCHWRGAWILLNEMFASQPGLIGLFTGAVLADLLLLRCATNLLAPPYILTVDSPAFVFRFPTRYNKNSRDWPLYILDCAFSVGVVGTLVVFVWRGAWVLFDLYLFPDNRERSSIGSLVLGYVLVVGTFTVQPLMRRTCARLAGLGRLLAVDGFLLLSFVGTVNMWRGIWNLLDLWLLPDQPKLSCWITHLGCFLFLMLLNCSNSVLVRGVYIDAEEDAGNCIDFPCQYLRLFFKAEREKKEARRRKLIAASRLLQPGNNYDKDVENGGQPSPASQPLVS